MYSREMITKVTKLMEEVTDPILERFELNDDDIVKVVNVARYIVDSAALSCSTISAASRGLETIVQRPSAFILQGTVAHRLERDSYKVWVAGSVPFGFIRTRSDDRAAGA